jgi:hypothetical protein
MARRRVEVEIILLNVLAVVPLAVGEAEEPFLQDGVLPVPQGERETEVLPVIGYAAQPVFAPPVGPGARLVVGEIVPGVPRFAVIFPHRAPLPLGKARAPLLPG